MIVYTLLSMIELHIFDQLGKYADSDSSELG